MAEPTDEQKRFLIQQRISLSAIFDATGMRPNDYKAAMKAEEKFFAIGVTPCMSAGHTLRSRSGHCIQCDTSTIAFILRYYKDGYLYVFASPSLKMLKIGFSTDPTDRERTVNSFAYGGASDWGKIAHLRCKNAAQAEFSVHEKLSPFLAPQTYFANGRKTDCREIFSCSYSTVKTAIIEAVGLQESAGIVEVANAEIRFAFPDIARK
jgi:hypothetical protein